MNTPITQQMPRAMPQRNSPARKNAAIGSTHKYHAPWKNVEIAASATISASAGFRGGLSRQVRHKYNTAINEASVMRYGLPSVKRIGMRAKTIADSIAASHASGRFSHASPARFTRTNIVTTEKIT